jgi:DNA-binding GntR family transcriptional regulator
MSPGLYAWRMAERPGRVTAKYRQIADHFRAAIEGGDLKPGDQLPSQAAIEEQFSAAGGTVVHALDELRRAGMVKTAHGAGTFVLERRPPAADVTERVAELESRIDELECQVMDLRAAAGLSQATAPVAEAR